MVRSAMLVREIAVEYRRNGRGGALDWLRSLTAVLDVGLVVEVDTYRRTSPDTTLLVLRFDDGLVFTREVLAQVSSTAQKFGAVAVDLSCLPEGERTRFDRYLATFSKVAASLPTLMDALGSLGDTELLPQAAAVAPVSVRFRRGQEWHPGRIRALSPHGVFVAAGASPRPGEVLDIELRSAVHPAEILTRGTVVSVLTAPRTREGVIGFTARFMRPAAVMSGEISGFLAKARLPQSVFLAVPYRQEPRYALSWNVFMTWSGKILKLAMRDVSNHGFQVVTDVPLAVGAHIDLVAPLDDDEAPLGIRATVMRTACRRAGNAGPAGYGLALSRMPAHDAKRWTTFVDRVAQRAQCHVVVAAAPPSLGGLMAALSGAGYPTVGATDLPSLAQVTTGTHCAPDLVVVDGSLFANGAVKSTRAVSSALAQVKVRSLRVADRSPVSTRALVDAELLC
ncbi:MAG: PilZ domain-containing protein [Deltaproteobacteria bacterium]|nr:PilZ domain-containing protein [Deltaproteobacteria bacterium]